jgi:hypothetical protein
MKVFVVDLRKKNATLKALVMKLRNNPAVLRRILSV